jgi:hypothetical protein
MTKITFFKKNQLFIGFEVSGHTGKDVYGKDLLCAQISTVAQLAVVGVKDVAKVNNFSQISDGYLKVMVSEKDSEKNEIQFLFDLCLKSFKSIIIGEEKFAKLEVKNV